MPPKSLSLKKAQQGPPKNQKAITQFFKNTNVSNSQSVTVKKSSPAKEVEKVSVKRKATSPLHVETSGTNQVCTSNGNDISKKLKSEKQNGIEKSPMKNGFQNGTRKSPIKNVYHCEAVKKSPGKENDYKSAITEKDFDSLLRNDHVETNEKFKNCSPKKRSPLSSSQENNIENEIQNILDDDEIECKSNGSNNHVSNILCQARFSPNLYDIHDEDSPEVNKGSPIVKQSNGTPKMCSPPKSSSPLKMNKSPVKCAKVLEFDDPEVDSMFGDDWTEDIDEETVEDLDLSVMQRCEIVAVNSLPNRLELKLKNATNNRATCFVEGIWLHTPLHPGDIVSILTARDSSGSFTVTNSSGLLVLRPDRLVSSTSVVAGVFCQRKAVLQERWRGIDSANTAMTIGILVHELVQKALTQNIRSVDQLRKEASNIIKESIQSLYDAGLSEEEARSNMQQYIAPLAEFMQMYMSDKLPPNMGQKDKWCGNINKVLDIEENLCCPQLGLKGKIDATLQVTIHERKGHQTAVVPLELKSGRASASAEHRGQLVLYGMMLALQRAGAARPATSEQRGLLLYLKERVDLREVSCGYPERRDLIMLRNQLVQYLADGPTATDPEQMTDIEEASSLLQQNLPEPVNHHNACAKCPYLTVCSLHLWHTNGPTVSENHPLSKLKQDALGHLSAEHIKYFLHWTALLKMEETGQMSASPLHTLWTDTVEKRSKRGTCAPNLRLKSVVQSGDRYTHTFERQSINNGDKTQHKTKGPQEGDFSIVNIDNRPWIAAGVVTVSKENEMQIILERDLSRRLSKDTMFHIDTYELHATTVQNLTNLGVLLEDSDRALRLRKIIIDKKSPEFEKKLPREVGRLGTKMMKSLNIQQQRAVFKAVAAKDYALLQGLPGTGKTQTISVLIQMLVALKQRVLVTAHTHSAVDTVLSRLPESLKVMRLGSAARVAPSLLARCEHQLASKCETPDQLEQLYNSMEVVGVTCLGAAHAMLARTTFDICIVDEATQVLQCTVLRPMFAANRFVLVGDPEQLPPVVRSRAARRLGMEESLFHRLMTKEATSTLQLQYRMNQALADLANKVAYNDKLKCANENVAQAKLNINTQKLSAHTSESWVLKACSADPENAVLFFDMKMAEKTETSNKTCANPDEACVVMAIVEALTAGGVKSQDIGVISPFREQVALLRRALSVEVSTVDQFQGRDKSVIVYSCTRRDVSDNKVKEGEVLNDQRRLAVGVTRAKHKLLIVGNSNSLQRYVPLKRLIDVCPSLVMERETINQVVGKYGSVVS
ncbi:DNA replication ATP-dependent helicase/nuclease DNA2 [Cydia strobilella]|uniref:DNA replication ATP-dependent helicase/nuclease DNA2 n=1 Tax=Cydia strobilella TaxID=1100964 RepID=UPI0030050163